MSDGRRHCARCRSPLASDNRNTYCTPCGATVTRLRQHPPAVPPEFWSDPAILDAARRRHMGHLISAYRRHPAHGIPISQEIAGAWVGVSQGQISRMENGQPEHNLDRLVHWAQLLSIPARLLWFDLPVASGQDPASRALPTALSHHDSISAARLVLATASAYGEDAAHRQQTPIRHQAEEGDDLRRRALLAALISAVASPFSPTSATASPPANARALAMRVRRVRSAYQHSSYERALRELPTILSELANPALTIQVDRLAAEAYQVASGLLLKSDQPTLAAIAAERSIVAARADGSPKLVASSMRAVVHGLIAARHFTQAAHLASAAATDLMRDVRVPSDDESAVYGALLLRGAVAAAHAEDRAGAAALLDEASAAADHAGTSDGNACWTAFGPANVLAHRVAVAVELGDAGAALEVASTINLQELAAPERRAVVMLDAARALTQWGKYDRALVAIQTAERHAPEEVRNRRSVHTLIETLAQRAPAPVQSRVRAYSCSIGVA